MSITVTPTISANPAPRTFALAGSASGGTAPYSYTWTCTAYPSGAVVAFDDNTFQNPSVTVDKDGAYTFSLASTGTVGGSGTGTVDVTVGYLATLATVKLYAGETTSANDTKYTNALAAATKMIQAWCDQDFISATATEYYTIDRQYGSYRNLLTLNHRPITAIQRIATRLESVITASNTSSSNAQASVAVTSTGVTLSRTASGSTTTNTLTFASYPTMTLLAAAITALGNGWTASANSSYSGLSSGYLKPIQIVNASSNDGPADLVAHVQEVPWMNLDAERGQVFASFPSGFQGVEVRYTAGYAEVPADVQSAAAALSASLFRISSTDKSLAGEKIGDYSYQNAIISGSASSAMLPQLAPDAMMLLQPYRRIAIA